MVVTGAGPGIMQAAMEGAGREHSIGVAIRLPFEQGANPVIAGDDKYVAMRYFFTRKLMLVKESRAFVCLPGGFGTLDETFELLTLTQTGKGLPVPIILLDAPGRAVLVADRRDDPGPPRRRRVRGAGRPQPVPRDGLVRGRRRPRSTASTPTTTRSATSATTSCCASSTSRPTRQLDELNERFAHLVARGRIERAKPFDIERRHADHVELPRIRFVFRGHRSGDLRALIDAVNELVPPPTGAPRAQ